jgi:hypothetical protein
MGSRTIWYRIKHADYPQCDNSVTLGSFYMTDTQAERLAENFAGELRFVTGLDTEIEVWVD